jgi:hypothetical protein
MGDMIHVKTSGVSMQVQGPDDAGRYCLRLSASGESCEIDLGVPRGMIETALLMAASVKFRAALPPAQPDAPSNLQKVHIAPDAPAWKGNDAFCASLRNVPENAFKHAPAPDAVQAMVKAEHSRLSMTPAQFANMERWRGYTEGLDAMRDAALAAIRGGAK